MALFTILGLALLSACVASPVEEMSLANVTRLATGDLFSLIGSDCGPTRCMEVSHGTALATMGGDGSACMCRCRRQNPVFREDQRVCIDQLDECRMATFGRDETKPQIPLVFLPLKGQIIYPSKEIIFTDVEDAICAVTSAQYLTSSGWVALRDLMDNDVPFGLYRDEGSTFLQWRGSVALHARLEGRLVAVHVLCSASSSSRLAASCAAFRVAGASQNGLLDVRSIPFQAGDTITTDSTTQNQGLSVLESLAIGVCVLMLIFVYAAGIIFYIHYKQRQKKKQKDLEQNMSGNMSDNGSSIEPRIDMSNVMMKTNPLLKLNGMGNDFFTSDNNMSDGSERTDDLRRDSPHNSSHKFQKTNSNVISAMVHSRRKKPSRPSIRSVSSSEHYHGRMRRAASPDTFERAPHSDLSIVDCSVENNSMSGRQQLPSGENALRRKLYFNPVFFETELLKNPPPAAIDFLVKIREVMTIAKDKMTSKRFIPMLSDIPEEDLYKSIDLGWDLSCARRGRRFSAISLKQENTRKSMNCSGCPGCDSNIRPQKAVALARSNSCKSCVSDDYKQRIVRKWLDEVAQPPTKKPAKPTAKVSPKVIDSQLKEPARPKSAEPLTVKPNPTPKETAKKEKKEEKVVQQNVKDDKSDTKKLIEEVKTIISKPLKPKENTTEEKKITKPMISHPKPISPNSTVEKKSPSSQASRQIRKKLPPPPPPPVVAKPTIKPPEPIKKEEIEKSPKDMKVKMEAVIRELNTSRVEPTEIEEMKVETITPIAPKIVIPVIAADSYYSDDNTLGRKRELYVNPHQEFMDFDSLERSLVRRRRFSLACGTELAQPERIPNEIRNKESNYERLAKSWRDVKKAVEEENKLAAHVFGQLDNKSRSISEISINTPEPTYNNTGNPGPLTIQVRGSPIENRRNIRDDFDPDTLDRKPKHEVQKRVEKILLRSAGSFKCKAPPSQNETQKKAPQITQKIGNLREIYEAKAKAQAEEIQFYQRRGSVPCGGQEIQAFMRSLKAPDLIRHIEKQKERPPVPPKQRRGVDLSPKFTNVTRDSPPGGRRGAEERERFSQYSRVENLNARKSGRRSARTRSRRTDLRRLYRTEDSGYMSTDSNESKRRASYLMQLRPKLNFPEPIPAVRTVMKPPIQIESDTDDLESLCDGRSESGGESVETDSVFFGNFDDSKEMLAELGLNSFERRKSGIHEQIDSGFMGETNIILSGDSDSEHRSVISIVTGHDGRTSKSKLEEPPYLNTIEC